MAGFTIVSTQVIIARNAGALYGVEVGTSNMASYASQAGSNTDAFLNTVYTNSVGNTSTSTVADVLITNLGITDAAAAAYAKTYIVGQLNAVAYTARGAVVNTILSNFSNLTSDPTYGAYATAWNNQVNNAVTYATVSGNPDSTFATVSKVPAGQIFTLTTGVDSFTGGAGNDTFNAVDGTSATFSSLDSIDGGAGTDTLNWTNTVAALTTVPAGTTVKNIEVVNFTDIKGATLDVSGWTGLTTFNATATGVAESLTAASTANVNLTDSAVAGNAVTVQGGNAVTVTTTGGAAHLTTIGAASTAPAGAVVVNNTYTTAAVAADGGTVSAPTSNGVIVVGGSTVNVTETVGTNTTNANTAVLGAVSVTGSSATTAVTVNQSAAVAAAAAVSNVANTSNAVAATSGVTNGTVYVVDKNAGSVTVANTITAVTLANYGNATVSSTALNTVTLSGTGGTLGLTEGGSTTTVAANKTLTANLGGGTLGVITDSSAQFSTVNAVMSANTTVGGITDSALRTLNVSGTGVLTLSAANTNTTAINVTGAAGLNADISGMTGITAFTAANTTGNNTITVSANQSYTGGSGNDTVTVAADVTKTISGGAGTDKLILNAAGGTFTATNTGANVSGFETIAATASVTGTQDMSVFSGYNLIETTGNNNTTFTKVVAGTGLQLDAASAGVVYQTADTNGVSDSVTVTLKGVTVTTANGGGTSGYTTAALTLQDANAVGTGTVNIVTDASVYQGLDTITTLTDSALSNLNISGTGSLSITNQTTGATSLTIADNGTGTSATADGIVTLTAAANALGSINYSGTHAFTIGTLSDTVANATITNANTGTSGVLTVSGWTDASLANLTLNGSVALTGTFALNGAATFSGATDNQAVSITASGGGVKTITLGNGADTIVTGAAADIITLGSGANTVTGGAGGDKITFASHATGTVDTVKEVAAGNSYTGSVTSGTTVLTLAAGADVVYGMQAGDKIDLVTIANTYTAALSTTLNAASGTTADIVRGNYNTSTGIFTASSTGTDSLVQYDNDAGGVGTAIDNIVLVGFVNTASSAATGVITLA